MQNRRGPSDPKCSATVPPSIQTPDTVQAEIGTLTSGSFLEPTPDF